MATLYIYFDQLEYVDVIANKTPKQESNNDSLMLF